MKLNYFKDFDDLKVDFAKMTIEEQSQELSEMMSHYSWLVREDMKDSRVLTSQTKRAKKLYDILRFEYEKRVDAQSE